MPLQRSGRCLIGYPPTRAHRWQRLSQQVLSPGAPALGIPEAMLRRQPKFVRRYLTEPCPRSWKLSSVLSAVSRTSPTVFRPEAASTFRIRVGNRTRSIGVWSGNSGLGSIRSRSVIVLRQEPQLLSNGRPSYNRWLTLALQRGRPWAPHGLLSIS